VASDGDTAEAMLRLNQAWQVLRDPQRRRQYDAWLATPAVAPRPVAVDQEPEMPVEPRRRVWFLRPSFLILGTLAGLFLVTAYAGSWPGTQGTSSPPTTGGVNPVGRCLAATPAAGLNVLVPCTSPNDGQILAEVASVDRCPTGTVGHLWTLRPTVLCTTPDQTSP
jgi:hypothetical protein